MGVVRFLHDCGVDLCAARRNEGLPSDGATPLTVAAEWGRLGVVAYLHASGAVDVDAANPLGETPLFIACEKGRVDVARYLHRRCGASVEASTRDGTAPLYAASRDGLSGRGACMQHGSGCALGKLFQGALRLLQCTHDLFWPSWFRPLRWSELGEFSLPR